MSFTYCNYWPKITALCTIQDLTLGSLDPRLPLTDQPEQQTNAKRAEELGLNHKTVVWRGDPKEFSKIVHEACSILCQKSEGIQKDYNAGHDKAVERLNLWSNLIVDLVE
ncbi:hypothetical protein ACMXYN_09480 [Neptuniibacter sp. PT8_73]|uniref:hypothetical protein n=1 Tax=Neptuniibacter sp. PT8_73 TaxID=3398206 RepID=UPI0039F4DE15